MLDTVVAFWYFPSVFFFWSNCYLWDSNGSPVLLLFPLYRSLSYILSQDIGCFVIEFPQIPCLYLSHSSLWVRFWSRSIYPQLSPPIMLSASSLQEPRCAISASMCLPDVFILFWRILFVQLFCCGVWEQLFLYIFLPFFCCIYPYLNLLFFVVCLPSAWWFYVLFCCWVHSQPSIVPHDPRHILINKNTFCLFCPSCQQAL